MIVKKQRDGQWYDYENGRYLPVGHGKAVQMPFFGAALFWLCAVIVCFAIGKAIWDNAHDPAYPLQKDAVQIQWQQMALHDANVIRRKQGLPELREDESPLPALRAKYEKDLAEYKSIQAASSK